MVENESFQKRVGGAKIFIGLLFVALLARLWYLQIVQGEKYRTLSRRNSIRILNIPAPRGSMVDRNGQLLAGNTGSYQLCVLPATRSTKEKDSLADSVSALLGLPRQDVLDKLECKDIPRYSPIILKPDLTPAEIQKVEENLLCWQNVFVRQVSARFYPHGGLAAHVLGYVGSVSRQELAQGNGKGYYSGQIIGKDGIEKSLEEVLTGQQGVEELQVDAAGRLVDLLARKPETAGAKVVLTLDVELQRVAEKALGSHTGCAILMDSRNGEILALASSPGINSQKMAGGLSAAESAALFNDPRHPCVNRAFMSRYAPGSVFKIVTLFAALEAGVASPATSVVCSGSYKVGNHTFRCWRRSGHGRVDLRRAVAESCDVFFYEMGQKVGIDRIIEAAKKLGISGKTGVDLPGEIPSIIPDPAWKKEHYGTPWYTGDTINAAIGQGFMNVTPLGLAVLTATVASQGEIVTPHVVKKVEGAFRSPMPLLLDTNKTRHLEAKPSSWSIIRDGMRAAVTSPTGTAKAVGLPYVSVAAKTGSAESRPGTRPHAWFICFAPYDRPQVACVVMVEEGGAGGETSAPIARLILEAYFSRSR